MIFINISLSPYLLLSPVDNKKLKITNYLTGEILYMEDNDIEIIREYRFQKEYHLTGQLEHDQKIHKLLDKKVLIKSEIMWEQQNIAAVEIETTTYCNWKCEYCPSSQIKRPKTVMPMWLFNSIIDSIQNLDNVTHITLHYYNEPTLDPLFLDRIKKIAKTKLKVMLFTNGSGLNNEKLEILKSYDVISKIYFTLPSVNPIDFERMTGTKDQFGRTIDIIQRAQRKGFDVNLSVQGPTNEKKINRQNILKKIHCTPDHIAGWLTYDRAGILKGNKYFKNTNITSNYLFGCPHIINRLYIDVDGNFILCDQDFYKKTLYANIRDADINTILKSPKIVNYRKQIFGGEKANQSIICRKCQRMEESEILRTYQNKLFNL